MININSGGFGFFAFIALLWGMAVTIVWIVIGWRAMRAHEKLADAAELASTPLQEASRGRIAGL